MHPDEAGTFLGKIRRFVWRWRHSEEVAKLAIQIPARKLEEKREFPAPLSLHLFSYISKVGISGFDFQLSIGWLQQCTLDRGFAGSVVPLGVAGLVHSKI